jgi:hypothetical protein
MINTGKTIWGGEFKTVDDINRGFRDAIGWDEDEPATVAPRLVDGDTLIAATYDQADYEGYATVIFKRGGKLYMVEASHCSCYGLEEQWNPEEILEDVLRLKKFDWYVGDGAGFRGRLHASLDEMKDEATR